MKKTQTNAMSLISLNHLFSFEFSELTMKTD